jgi:hypothetical protein
MKWENETCESLKLLKGAKLEDLEDALVIRIGQVHTRNGTATAEVMEQVNVSGQQMNLTNFVHKSWYVFCYKK